VSTAIPATPAYGFLADLAPDGTFLIHQAWPTRPPESTKPSGALVVRRLDRDETRVLDGTEGATNAAISPDGRWLAFVAAQERSSRSHALRRIALTDGQPTGMVETLCTVPGTGGDICWVSDQEIALASAWDSTILVIPASGGEPRVALREENTSSGLENWGGISRVGDGKSILATRWTVAGDRVKERVELIDLAAGRKSDLLPGVSGALVIPGDGGSGILVASRNQSSLVAAPFDLATARVMGTPVTVWSGPALRGFRLSANGVLALSTESTDRSGRQLAFVDDAGEAKPLSSPARAYGPISLSPDGSKVAMMMESNEAVPPLEVWIHDLERRTFTCLKTPGIPIGPCAWTRDGLRVTYGAVSEAEVAIWEQPVNGAGEATKVYAYSGNGTLLFPVTWSPDGAVLALMQIDMASGRSGTLLLERTPGSREWTARTFTNPRANSTQMMFSPDMRWVALTSAEAGDTELYVQRYTGADSLQGSAPAERHQISNSGASSTLWWSADGKEIRYIGGDWQVMSVAITTEPQFAAAVPKVVASLKGVKTTSQAFAPDGRLMVVLRGENEQVAHIDLALNFMPELRARMAQAK
jgi:Tol biopolymer transport system component